MDFAGKRLWFFLVSLVVILPGIVFLIIAPGLKPGIDFTGGSTIILEFSNTVSQDEVRSALADLDRDEATVQNLGDDTFFIRTKEMDEAQKTSLVESLESALSPDGVDVLAFDRVSAVVAQETVLNAFWAVLAAAVGIFFYVWWAFRNLPSPLRYGAAAIIALLHDTIIVIGIFAILGYTIDMEVNTMFLIALLTVIGYSVNDTIVVFDRLRENISFYPTRRFTDNVNVSISETLSRSFNTSFTLLFTLMALMLFGGETIRSFLLVLIIGVVVGTYSSIGIASQLLVVWDQGDIGRLYRRVLRKPEPAAATPARAR
ncbi:MAG: protein translocase subunit SecF [Chloroflexi bacterium]|nr:protein translocase subunit SecF [Chloroflexota bacterium]